MAEMQFFNEEVNNEIENSGSVYMSLEPGKNEIRIVSGFAWGYKYNFEFRAEGKEKDYPHYRKDDPFVANNKHKLTLVCSMVVYDYGSESLKILNIQQKNILKMIREYAENPKYGDPTKYDLIINKTGEGKETRYTVVANPPEDMPKEVQEALSEVEINIENVFEDGKVIVNK